MDNLEFLDGAEAPNAEATPVETEQPTQEVQPQVEAAPPEGETAAQTEARVRDEKGRFKAKETEQPVMVPLQALHETRDKVRDLEARLAAVTQPQQPQVQQVPDVFEDPDGRFQYEGNALEQRFTNRVLNLSEATIRRSAGDEVVNAAQEWAKQAFSVNPQFQQVFLNQPDPYGFIVDQYQRYSAVSQITGDPDQVKAFLAWKSAQGQVQQQPGQAATPQSSPTPRGSIASATSAGGVAHAAFGPGVAFGDTIK